ncbi:MAG TPA: alpha/beta hydrolase fold domain-containing protein [Gemmataceae bacterium]|nr:alpha/beta hydrolase fold domain-containing protein [Gemmataceae bacterium]
MKRFSGTALLVCVVAVGAYAVDDDHLQPKASVQKDSTAIPNVDKGDIPPPSGAQADKPRTVSRESIEYLQRLRKNTPFGTKGFDLAALRAGMGSRREPTFKGIKLIRAKIGDIPCEWVLAPGADPDLRLLYLHGGGFVSGSGGFYLTLAAHISAAAKCAVLLPDYRLAPEHRFPAGLEDCIRAHKWMIANGPSGPAPSRATFIAGDSAGGSLTLATLLALRDRRLLLPACGIPLSPTTDLTLASESLKTVNDPIISAKTMPVLRDHYLGKTDPRNPLASPVFGDYRGIPPLLIQVGEHEMLRDDSIRVAKKARSDGIRVKLEVWPGMFHVFQSHEPLLPEGREAIDHIADFMRSSLPVHVSHVQAGSDKFTAVEHKRQTIYHSPQKPGFTCWLGAWTMPDGSLMTSFTQATGPIEGRPKAPKDVQEKLNWPPPGAPGYDMTGLEMKNVHLRSKDSGKTWKQVSADAFKTCMNGVSGEAETALADGTVIRGVFGFYLPYDSELPKTGYLQRSRDGTLTWGKPEVLLDPKKYSAWPRRIRVLRDGRLIVPLGVARVPAGSHTRSEFSKLVEPMLVVSSDKGKTWKGPIAAVPNAQRGGWTEELDAAELANGDLLCVFRRDNDTKRWQEVLKKSDDTWVPGKVGPSVLPHDGQPELLATREGPILHVASGIHWTNDAGQTWHKLQVPGAAYYPRSIQAADGRIFVFGHVGGDNTYGKVDQSIVMDSFRLKVK